MEYFKNVELEQGKQDVHIKGTNNFDRTGTKSIFEHKDPVELLKKHAGTGIRVRGEVGEPGYKEVVDFNEHIGIWKNVDGTLQLPTTRGTIHYSKKGAHIVPARPLD